MTRLTNYDRDKIESEAVQAAFVDREKAIKTAEDVLGRRCYDSVFSTAERKAAKALPAYWCRLDACLRFNVGGLDVRLDLIGDGVPVPATGKGGNSYCHRLGSVSDPALVEAVHAHLNALEALKEERKTARRALRAVLNSVTTVKSLQAAWPEGERFWSSVAVKAGEPGLPAPQISELNVMLGLVEAA